MKRLLILGALLCCISCSQDKTEHSFYYWKTSFENGESKTAGLIRQMGINHFYIRIMDVDWSERLHMPVPVSPLDNSNIPPVMTGMHYTPVVFITNRTFEKISESWCDSLAGKLAAYLDGVMVQPDRKQADTTAGRHFIVDEIQIDCDWTPSTKARYFHFLTLFKARFPDKKLSATIRLYPYKYPQKMGVPPVDKGLLMCYNLGRIDKADTRNSILDPEELKLYLGNKKYELPLDIALPVFGWYAWFRGSSFKGIIYENELNLADTFFDKSKLPVLRARQDIELAGKYLREGDVLRSEFPDEAGLVRAAKMIKAKVPGIKRVAFYHWDEPVIHHYENTIRLIYGLF